MVLLPSVANASNILISDGVFSQQSVMSRIRLHTHSALVKADERVHVVTIRSRIIKLWLALCGSLMRFVRLAQFRKTENL